MRRRRAIASHLGAAACVGLLLSGAAPPGVPLACMFVMLVDAAWLAPRGWMPRSSVLLGLQVLLAVPFAYLALLRDPPVDFLTLLLVAAAPLIVVRSFHEETEFNDFLIILLSLLVVVGSAALAPGALPVLITAVYLLVGCQALRALACGRGEPAAGVRYRLERPPGWWALAPAFASHHLALGGLMLGGVLYLLAPQPGGPRGGAGAEAGGGLLSAGAGTGGGSRTSAARPDFPREIRLGDLGRLKRRFQPALQVELRARGRPYDPGERERTLLLLRARVWERFVPAERRWELPRVRARPLPPSGVIEAGETELDWTIDVLGYDGKTVFLPQRARRVRAAGGAMAVDRTGTMSSSVPVFEYSVASAWPVRPDEIDALVADAHGNGELLQVPDAAARVLPAPPRGPRRGLRDALAAVAGYFADGFRYTLELPPEIEAAPDPLAAFVERREGDCEMYATAACLMLRRLGIPARVAGGLRIAERLGPGKYLARLSNAHAWVEVPCRGVGFVPFDFTPPDTSAKPPQQGAGGGEEESEEGGPGGEETGILDWRDPFAYGPEERERVVAWLRERVLGWPFAAAALAFVLLLALPRVVAAVRNRPRSPLGVSAPKGGTRTTLAFYAQWLRACAAKGFVRTRVDTPREFLATLPPELQAEGRAITAEFERLRYGP